MIQFVSVSTSGRRRLIAMSDVVEIVPMLALEEVSGRLDSCRGVANIRGEIVPVFDLTGPEALLHPSRFIIVSLVEGALVGLVVDDVHDVLSIPRERVKRVPVGGGRSVTMVNVDDMLVSVIDPGEALVDAR